MGLVVEALRRFRGHHHGGRLLRAETIEDALEGGGHDGVELGPRAARELVATCRNRFALKNIAHLATSMIASHMVFGSCTMPPP